jgi:hypothetical protein
MEQPAKRKHEDTFIAEEDILKEFIDDTDFANLLIESQRFLKEGLPTANPDVSPLWKQEISEKLVGAKSIDDLNQITKEILKKNKVKKPADKKLVRVENFYQRHIGGIKWMENFLKRTKADAISKPYVQRMLEMEYQIKKMIEEDETLKNHLSTN